MEIVLAIAGILLTLAGYAVPEAIQYTGKAPREQLTKIAREIYTRISNNNTLLNKIATAYQNKNGNYINEMFQSAGFGDRVEAIKRAIKKNDEDYESQTKSIEKENAKLQSDYNETSNAYLNSGNSITGNVMAQKVAEQMSQYLNGGLDVQEKK